MVYIKLKRIKIGLIGLGGIGQQHLIDCSTSPYVNLVAAADLSKSALQGAKKLGVKNVYRDYKELLKQNEVEAVIISLPNHLHLPCVITAAEAGKHILLGKPIARNIKEGEEILSVTN